jgi:hypothetical protein
MGRWIAFWQMIIDYTSANFKSHFSKEIQHYSSAKNKCLPCSETYFPHISPTFSLNIFRAKQVDLSRRLRRRRTDQLSCALVGVLPRFVPIIFA